MKAAANSAFGVVLLVAALLPVVRANVSTASGELAVTTAIALLPLWVFLSTGMSIAVAHDGFDWLLPSRALQYGVVLGGCAALVLLTWFVAGVWKEPDDDSPWIVQLVLASASFALPAIAGIGGLFAVNAGLRDAVPALAWRLPLVGACGLSAAVLLGMVLHAFVDDERNAVRAAIADGDATRRRDAEQVAEIAAMDPIGDLAPLLRHTNVFNEPAVRNAALARLASHPALGEALAARIAAGGCDEALTFLEGADVPDPGALALPVRDAIACMAERTRVELRGEGVLFDDFFDGVARRALAAADRYAAYGVDQRPAVRALREAMDEPNRQGLRPRCRATLDRWLAEPPGQPIRRSQRATTSNVLP